VGIAAPLLIRSTVLSDIELIALIGRHGLPHARAIGRRRSLNPTIADLVRALERPSLVKTEKGESAMRETRPASPAGEAWPAAAAPAPADTAAESVRRRLRTMMLPTGSGEGNLPPDLVAGKASFAKLRAAALSGRIGYFQMALADVLGIGFRQAEAITEATGYADLILALRVLELEAEQAFLLAAAIFPAHFGRPEGIRLFIDRYRLSHREAARERLRGWKAETLAASLARETATPGQNGLNSNRREQPPAPGVLKAS
jgi:uncharacterized protein (DUF2336 family)